MALSNALCAFTADMAYTESKVNLNIPLWNEEVKLVLRLETCFDETV